jgi:hypothetical protein
MGSFTEFVLAFTFAPSTPNEIIGAFAEWRVPHEPWRTGTPEPELPTLETSLGADAFDADAYLAGFYGDDPTEGLSPLHQAALWRWLMRWDDAAYFSGKPSTALLWDPYGEGRWSLTSRAVPKDPVWLPQVIVPLGRWAADGSPDRPWFVGYVRDEYTPRPVLVWSVGEQPFRLEGELAER